MFGKALPWQSCQQLAKAKQPLCLVQETHLITCTCALMTKVLFTVKPSSTLFSSMNFFQPQSCSFLQNLCSVSAKQHKISTAFCRSSVRTELPFEQVYQITERLLPRYLSTCSS